MRSFLEIWYFSWKHDTFPLNLRPLVMYLRCSFQFGALTNTLWNLPDYVEMISVVFETSRLSLRAFMMHLWNFLIYLNPSYMTETLLVLSMTLPEIIETLPYHMASPIVQLVKNLPANAGYTRDTSLIPGSVRSPGEGNGSPLQYSCLENSMDSGAWWATIHGVTKSQTWLSALTHTYTHTLPYGSAISLLGIYSLRNKNWCSHKTCTQMFIVAYIILFILFGYY